MEKMMKYPYIGGIDNDCKTLFLDGCYGIAMEHNQLDITGIPEHAWSENEFINITHEYLKNTCGEVVSPEHADFIIELAELHGFKRAFTTTSETINTFAFKGDNLYLYSLGLDELSQLPTRKITIPLPPKADNQESSEWPQIGDEVCWSNRNHKAIVVYLCDSYAWVKSLDDEIFNTVRIDKLKKPKTPEEVLRNEIAKLVWKANDLWIDTKSVQQVSVQEFVATKIIEKYDIKKKPQ